MMCPAIYKPVSCEIRAVVRCVHSKFMIAAELCAVYSHNVMSGGIIRERCRMFKDRRTDVHDEEGSGRPAICNE